MGLYIMAAERQSRLPDSTRTSKGAGDEIAYAMPSVWRPASLGRLRDLVTTWTVEIRLVRLSCLCDQASEKTFLILLQQHVDRHPNELALVDVAPLEALLPQLRP